jgi:hypothetical protein
MEEEHTADQAGQTAVGLGTEPHLGLTDQMFAFTDFYVFWNLLSVIPAGTAGQSSFFFSEARLLYFYYYSFAVV